MCGRSRQTVAPQALASAVGFSGNVPLRRASHYVRRENAHPGNATPIAYRTNAGSNALRSMRWGLIPSFTKKGDKPDFFRMFNARSETAAEKPSFRRLVGRRHGVVAFTGFYEWKRDEKGERQPYYFYFADGRPLLKGKHKLVSRSGPSARRARWCYYSLRTAACRPVHGVPRLGTAPCGFFFERMRAPSTDTSFAVLYDTWQQGDGFSSSSRNSGGSGSAGDKSRAAAGSSSKPDNPNGETEEQRREREGNGTGDGQEHREEAAQTALLEREVEEEDRGESLMFSYAVLTTSAAPRLTWLHERMPVILRGPRDAAAWLGCKGAEASTFLKNHAPYSGEDLVWHPVSKQMNTMRYDAEDCSAAIELKKPEKPLPAITTFFKKKGPEPEPEPARPATTPTGGGHGGGIESCGAGSSDKLEKWGNKAGAGGSTVATPAAAAAAATKTPFFPPSPSTPGAKRSRPGSEDAGSGAGATAAAAAAAPSPHASSPRSAGSKGNGSKRARTTAGSSPSPRKGGSKAGAAAAAAATRDKKQSKLTSFFSTPC